jgi:hypothetical protein
MGWKFRATSACGRRDVGNTKYTYQGDSGLSVLDMESDLAIVYNSGKEIFFFLGNSLDEIGSFIANLITKNSK